MILLGSFLYIGACRDGVERVWVEDLSYASPRWSLVLVQDGVKND